MRRLLVLVLAATACGSTDNGTIQLVTGGETDAFTQAPAPTQLVVTAVDITTGEPTTLATASLPPSSIDLGTQQEDSDGVVLEVKGTDANGNELLFGASLPIGYGNLAGTTIPLFVQRTNAFARLPSPPADTRTSPVLADIAGEFLFIGGGAEASLAETTQLYDFGGLATLSSPPVLPRAPLSMPVIGTVGLLIDGSGGTYYDFGLDQPTAVTAPTGYAFGDVAGGQTVYDATDGTMYVVGATRTAGAGTAAVLFVNPNDTSDTAFPYGNMKWLSLSVPRLGATATWIDGIGLVVTGGSATAPGVEVVGPGDSTGTALPFPPDASIGAGSTELDSNDILVAGGVTPTGDDAGARAVDLSCTASCGFTTWTSLPLPVTSASVFWLGSGAKYTALAVGSEVVSGLTHAYLLNSTSATEIPTRVPHTNAQAIVSPAGSVVLVGGAAEIESFWPTL